jgi:6-pyruvoyltetrahydropterin/6-carboxytetrahydropterin synthase
MGTQTFRVHVTKDYLKFSAAHFIAYKGFRETLHGHNYRVSVEIEGDLGPQGYVLDFGIVKQVAKRVCSRLDEKCIIPAASDCLRVRQDGAQVTVGYDDDEFCFPCKDVVVLPIVHSSAEELARYIAGEIRRELRAARVEPFRAMEIGVEETTGQAAYFRESR